MPPQNGNAGNAEDEMEVEPPTIFQDIFGNGSGAGATGGPKIGQPGDGQAGFMNAYDGEWTLDQWRTGPLSMNVPLPDQPVTCEDICIKRHKDADEKCSIARKRVELGLTKAGCPCKVLAVRRPDPCGKTATTASTSATISQFL
jgi:hypothetical protein